MNIINIVINKNRILKGNEFPRILLLKSIEERQFIKRYNYHLTRSVGKSETEMVKRALGEQGATLRSLGG